MWYEARRQEKQIRNAMVDVKKRAERRKDFYERIKEDPIRFLRLYGSKSKLNIDPEVAVNAENPNTLMTWVGDNETVIDRFDVRANLVHFDEKKPYIPTPDEKLEERMCNYERFRCLVHNQFAKVNESTALGKIEVTEKFGEDIHKLEKQNNSKKKNTSEKAAIGYVYTDSEYTHTKNSDDSDESIDSEPDLDMDLDIELDIGELSFTQQKELTRISQIYGMCGNDYLKLMKVDKTQEEEFRTAKLLEEQKAQFHGRKSRRERKIFKEQRLKEKYMQQDPKTLSFGASVFYEEQYVGKDILTPSPEDQVDYSSSTEDTNKQQKSKAVIPSQKSTFINIPTIHDDDESSYKKHSSRKRRSSSHSSSVNGRHHHHRYRDSSRDKNRNKLSTSKRSKNSPYRKSSVSNKRSSSIKTKNRSYGRNKDSRSSVESDVKVHGYDFSGQRSPNAERVPDKKTEEEMLKKKYYRSESEKDNSDSTDYSTDATSSTSRSSSSKDSRDQQVSSSPIKSTGYGGNASSKRKSSINTIANKVDIIASKCNPQEFLKRQMEKQLNRAFCEDKKAEQEKLKKVEKERLDRENQLREMAVQIRKREREKFNVDEDDTLDTINDISLSRRSPTSRLSRFGPRRTSHSRSRSRSRNRRSYSRHRRSRSKSKDRQRNRHSRRRNRSKSSSSSHSSSSSKSTDKYSSSRHHRSNSDRYSSKYSNRNSHSSGGHSLLLPSSSSSARNEHYKSTKYYNSSSSRR